MIMNHVVINMIDINYKNHELHLILLSLQANNMKANGPPPKTRNQEYVIRTLHSMKDKVCNWVRLHSLVMYYYHNCSHLDPSERFSLSALSGICRLKSIFQIAPCEGEEGQAEFYKSR